MGIDNNDYYIFVVIVEFIYIVILLYDDVVDELIMCRGWEMVNVIFGN